MEVPYWIFLVIYLITLVVFVFFVLLNVYHMVRFGFFDFVGKMHTVLIFGVMAAILFSTGLLLSNVPWGDSFSVFEVEQFMNSFSNELPF